MRAPLTVRISDGSRDQQVTRFVKGLRFTKTAPGGHHSASISIDAPEGLFGDLGPADRVFIYDGRNARTVWDGYVENPGRATVAGGARYDLSAMGGVVLASDNARSVVFVHRDLSHSHWKNWSTVAAATLGQDGLPPDSSLAWGPGFKAHFPHGTPVDVGQFAAMLNTSLQSTGQPIYRINATATCGRDDVDFVTRIDVFDDSGALMMSSTPQPFSTGPANISLNLAPTFGWKRFALVAARVGPAGSVTADTAWAWIFTVVVRPGLFSASGAYAVPVTPLAVYGHEVVGHLVGSGALAVDAAATTIEAGTVAIDNLAYLDAVKPSQILDDLSFHEPDLLWEVLESNPAGKHRFNYRRWPTTPRYEISGADFNESGGEMDLCNRIVVSWVDATGAEQTTVRTTTVAALGSRVKDADPIALPEGQGSPGNAERIGDEVLAALNSPARSGTAVVRQPILDRLSGLMVMPWEIEPGYLVRVRDTGVDLRLTEMTYDDADCAASLTLGTPTLTLAQRLARRPGRRSTLGIG